jgi:DeoR/GlpR family transcriptional regulator of sugar metabolism
MLALEHSDGGMTVKELVTLTGVRRTTIQSCLERLKEVGKVEGGGRGLRWRSPTSTTTTSNFPTTTDYLYTFPTTPSAPINRDTVKERSDEA